LDSGNNAAIVLTRVRNSALRGGNDAIRGSNHSLSLVRRKAMPSYDFRTPRLFVDAPLASGGTVPLDRMQTNYLCNVLRMAQGTPVLVFNGRDGEWLGALDRGTKKSASLVLREKVRDQTAPNDLHYLFAPLKHARLDYMVQKAVELGVSQLQPVITRHTQATRVNLERMRANAIEAAEQCGVLSVPDSVEPAPLAAAMTALDASRILIFCDERADNADPVAALSALKSAARPSLAVLIGPEGGFTDEEREHLLRRANTVRLALGPRILRADTAAVAALTLVQSVLGDWRV
jgi:16S rRNA (uracil1498-N3)-methyltransferase